MTFYIVVVNDLCGWRRISLVLKISKEIIIVWNGGILCGMAYSSCYFSNHLRFIIRCTIVRLVGD